jgi:hypothetical protein
VASQLSNNNCVPVRYPNLISLYQATTFMPDVFDFSSEERAESADERGSLSDQTLPAARPKRPPKRGPSNQYTAWTFKHELECDLFYAESTNVLTIEEKTNLQKEHLRNRLQHDQPRAVLACAVLVDSRVYFGPPARVSIPVTLCSDQKNHRDSSGSVDLRRKRLDACARRTLREPRVRCRHQQTRAVGEGAWRRNCR